MTWHAAGTDEVSRWAIMFTNPVLLSSRVQSCIQIRVSAFETVSISMTVTRS